MNNQLQPEPVEPAIPPSLPGKAAKKKSTLIVWLSVGFGGLLLVAIAIPNIIKAINTSYKNSCISNLRQLDGAKQQWQLENKKTETDTPTWADLVGAATYIKTMPVCPRNGAYTLGNMKTKIICSVPGHTLP